MTSTARRRYRRRILSWIPITVVALICVGFVVAANTMQNSWWTTPAPSAAPDQRSDKGMSMFTGTGIDYLTRAGVMKVEVRDGAESARALGLDPDGSRTFEPIVPIQAILLGTDAVIHLDLVRSVTLVTAEDAISEVRLLTDNDGAWTEAFAEVAGVAADWGYDAADLDALRSALADEARLASDMPYAASLPEREHHGARVSVEISVDAAAASVIASFTVRPL